MWVRNIIIKKTDAKGKIESIEFDRMIGQPESTAFPEGSTYKPIACAVDTAGRIYVVSSTTNMGIISMNSAGEFLGFLGAQKTAPSAWQIFWRMFQTKEQRAALQSLVPTEYNNIDIDDSGFIYATISSLDEEKMASAISSKSSSGDFAPVKKLNSEGTDVMLRTGFWPPSGEVTVVQYHSVGREANTGVSMIIDVALGQAGTWTIADGERQRLYTYDSKGNLLFIFGENGPQLGNNNSISSICYQNDKLLVLDRNNNSFTIYKRTAYGESLMAAIQNVEDRNYDQSAKFWQEVLLRNSNFDEAYIGIADSYYRAGEYEKAQEFYAASYDDEGYSKCYSKIRKGWIEDYIILIPIAVAVIAVLITKFFGYAAKENVKGQVMKDKRTFKEAALYGCHVIFHPFDGFWDLKHEKRGSARGATFWLLITALAFVYNTAGRGYLADPSEGGGSYYFAAMSIIMPVLLWSLGNWCLTTLFDGEGTLKDVYIATCYSLIPLPLLMVPSVMLTNVMSNDELDIVSMLYSIGIFWFVLLVFFGMMVTHDYTLGKNVLTTLGSIIGVAFIVFVTALFSALVLKVYTFIHNIYVELLYRWS